MTSGTSDVLDRMMRRSDPAQALPPRDDSTSGHRLVKRNCEIHAATVSLRTHRPHRSP